MEYIAKVEQGQIIFFNREILELQVQSLEGKNVSVRIQKLVRKRSDRQNRWYWGVAIPTIIKGIEQQSGEVLAKDTAHALALNITDGIKLESKMLFGHNVLEVKQKRTSDMTVEEFNEFYKRLQNAFAEKDIIIPDPNQDNFINQIC
tara:strand:+ start:3708 stop:4148 length:441 start_codon:yes stop_codon:yes gene_type:complete